MNEKELKKEKIQKLERKLQLRQLNLYDVLQEDVAVDWFRQGHPAFLSMLNPTAVAQMINYIITPGPAENKMRSYKIPMIATDILTIPSPKTFDLLFLEDQGAKGGLVLGRLVAYFQTEPNYIISGYVTRILMNLMAGNALRVLEFLMKNGINKILNFLQSHSIAEFILRILIVQDLLLNSFIKQRIQLYNQVIDLYAENKASNEILENAVFVLSESIIRLWTQKHKELGRFSTSLFKVVQLVIDNSHLYAQENLVIVVMKHLTLYSNQAPCLIVALYKKIYKQLLLTQNPQTFKNQAKQTISRFSMKNLKLLQSLNFIFTNCPQSILKQLPTTNVFTFLLEFPIRYEWNSIVLVEIQKIMKAVVVSQNQILYNAVFTNGRLLERIRDMIRKQSESNKFGRGYSGFLNKFLHSLKVCIQQEKGFGKFIRKKHPETQDVVQEYLLRKSKQISSDQLNFRVVHNVAKPYYNIPQLLDEFSQFFDQTQAINRKYQTERPSQSVRKVKEDVLHQIQNQNQLVYQLLAQDNHPFDEKKLQSMENGE